MRILTIIPARGGSKGVPRKNIRLLGGIPLIAWTILEADKLNLYPIVSTEDKEISDISIKYGAAVLERPAELAQDDTPMLAVIQHAIKVFDDMQYTPDWVLLLQPTCPFRTASDILSATALVKDDCDSVISVTRMEDYHPARMYKMCDGFLTPLFYGEEKKRRQDLSTIYHRNGAIYLTRRDIIMNGELWATRSIHYVMPPERSINIDSEIDLKLAEVMLENR